MKEFVIDLFCGAGGTSTGIHLANCDSTVTACVNHDAKAIESHKLNHPWAKHFVEDIRNPEVVFFLKLRVNALRKLYPGCIITIWASLECTNHSNAKGGMSRDADSRTLAEHLYMYLDGLDVDYLEIENVKEFLDWGPLRIKEDLKNSKKGKYSALLPDPKAKNKAVKFVMVPVKESKGVDYKNWVKNIEKRGFKYEYRLLNAADYGAFTSRRRYFAQFAKGDLPISWPQPTHAQNPENKEHKLKKWKAVKEVLQLHEEGNSIFIRKKPLVENTLKRIYAGLVKFVANGDDSFIKKYYSGRPAGKVISVNGPAGTITTAGGQGLVNCNFLLKYNSKNKKGKHNPPGIDAPCPTVAAQARLGVINANFLQSYYGNGNSHSTDQPCPTVSTKDRFGKIHADFLVDYQYKSKAKSINEPAPTIVTKDKFAKVAPQFLVNSYNGGGQTSPIDIPAPTIMNVPKSNLASCNFILNPQYSNKGNSIEAPAPTIIARQDKKPLGLISCELGAGFLIPVYDDDCETMVKIKIFMAYYGIVDIKMRMLFFEELLRIQGFPEGYQLVGTLTDKKKFIGNAVEVTMAKKLREAHHAALVAYFSTRKAA